MAALISTPTVASSSAGRSPVRKRAYAVRSPPSSRMTASASVADPEAQREVVETEAARAVLAGQHAGAKENQQEREPDAHRVQARQHADEDQRGGREHRDVDQVHASIVDARLPASGPMVGRVGFEPTTKRL